ncbi:hypothetical protein BGZ65_001769, partial [Modicella reniformis]
MTAIQLFRLTGTTDIKRIPCSQVEEQNVIYWEDIEHFFPGVKYVQEGEVSVIMARGSNRKRIEPYCIKRYPGVVLDVVLSITGGGDLVESTMSTQRLSLTHGSRTDASQNALFSASAVESVIESLQITTPPVGTIVDSFDDKTSVAISSSTSSPDPQGDNKTVSRTTLSFKQVVVLAQKKALESEIEQRLISSFSPEIQAQVRVSNSYNSMVQAIKEGQVEQSDRLMGCLLELKDSFAKNTELMARNKELAGQMIEMQRTLEAKQDEMKQLQIQALSHLALLQKQ